MMLNRCLAVIFCLFVATSSVESADADKPDVQVTLLGMYSEWWYPEAKFEGAQISDGGVTNILSTKCKGRQTTPDDPEKVLEFFCKKLNVDKDGNHISEKPSKRVTTNRAVTIQDNSQDRTLKLYIISVNETDFSTTLIISRTKDEEKTNIAWSNFLCQKKL